MLQVESPFIKQIPECKLIMRRLRKKISKYTSTHKQAKRPRDQSHDILNLLKDRNVPAFVLEAIKKRRSFDMLSLKNVVLGGEACLEEMKEIQGIFSEHKTRMRKSHTPRSYPKLQRRSTTCSSSGQQQLQEQQQEIYSNSQFDLSGSHSITNHRVDSKQIYTANQEMQGHNNFQEDIPGFHGRDFLLFQEGDIYSQEEWMRF